MATTRRDPFPTGATAKHERIAVAEKIIADISTGIYRTPAAAIKELLANAYDADATSVRITTDVPRFGQLVVKDNGHGMSLDRFLEVIRHIGGSWKRLQSPDGLSPKFKRPLIGRIGIGLLAVAQLGQRFFVSSSVRGSRKRFLAEVDLTPFHKDDAALRALGDEGAQAPGNKPIDIGHIRYVDGLPETKDSQFTVVTVPDPKGGVLTEIRSQLREALGAESSFSTTHRAPTFSTIVSEVQKQKSGRRSRRIPLLPMGARTTGARFVCAWRSFQNADTAHRGIQ